MLVRDDVAASLPLHTGDLVVGVHLVHEGLGHSVEHLARRAHPGTHLRRLFERHNAFEQRENHRRNALHRRRDEAGAVNWNEYRVPKRARDPEEPGQPVERDQVEWIEIREVVEGLVRLLCKKEVVDLRHERDEPLPSPKLAGKATRDGSLAILTEVTVRRLDEIGNR